MCPPLGKYEIAVTVVQGERLQVEERKKINNHVPLIQLDRTLGEFEGAIARRLRTQIAADSIRLLVK